jgi:SNF2 family DNA or RNA helicase
LEETKVIDFLVKPWSHQLQTLKKSEPLPYFGLFFEMGTGKTATAINIYRDKSSREGKVLRCLIIAPGITLHNWKREFAMHSKIADKVQVLEGSGVQRSKIVSKTFKTTSVFVLSYETLLMPKVMSELVKWGPEFLVFDESHRIKNPKAKRTKEAIKLSFLAKYRYILTGTPVLNTPKDLFTQVLVLDHGKTFGNNFYKFEQEYFIDMNAGMPRHKYFPNWQLKAGALDDIRKKLNPIAVSVKKSQCLDLPPLVKLVIDVELSPEQKKLYEAMKKDFIAYVDDKACIANLAITKALRLQQILSGFITLTTDDGEAPKDVPIENNPRAKALKELLEDITKGNKCLVWAVFRENYAAIRSVCDELGLKYVEVHGEVSAKDRQKALDAFNNQDDVRVFIGNPTSAGIGINLVSASYSIFYSRSFSLEADLQARARNHRGGSEIHPKVTHIDLVARDTIDEHILKALDSKEKIGVEVLRGVAKKL